MDDDEGEPGRPVPEVSSEVLTEKELLCAIGVSSSCSHYDGGDTGWLVRICKLGYQMRALGAKMQPLREAGQHVRQLYIVKTGIISATWSAKKSSKLAQILAHESRCGAVQYQVVVDTSATPGGRQSAAWSQK